MPYLVRGGWPALGGLIRGRRRRKGSRLRPNGFEPVPAKAGHYLQRLAEPLLKAFAVAAAERHFDAVPEEHRRFAAERRTQLLDLLDVDDGRAMDADELPRIELRFEAVHRFAKQVRVLPDMEAHVVAGRFAPFYLGGANEMHAARGANEEAF